MNDSVSNVPVLLVIFNRPDLTRRVWDQIRVAKPSKLFIAADGPREDRPGEDMLCEEARRVTRAVDWNCEVRRLERETNLGCKLAVSSAISWFFDEVEEGIILEDDCLPDPTFFRFCSELLDTYRDDSRVALISGNNFLPFRHSESYYFSRYPHIWGWASWRRFWRGYDVSLKDWNGSPDSLAPFPTRPAVRRYFAKRFDSVKIGVKDTWDFQLVHRCFRSASLCINPSVNLVENIGFDERATHTTAVAEDNSLPKADSMIFPLLHPSEVEEDVTADRYTEDHVHRIPRNRREIWKHSFKKKWAWFSRRFE